MSDRVNARLSKPLAEHVSRMVGTEGLFETPSEYVRSLIRRDMESDASQVYAKVVEGFEDMQEGRFFESTGDWKKDKEVFQKKIGKHEDFSKIGIAGLMDLSYCLSK